MNSNFTRMATAALVCAAVAGGVAYAQGAGGNGASSPAGTQPDTGMSGKATNGMNTPMPATTTPNSNMRSTDIKAGNVTPTDDTTLNRTGANSPANAANSTNNATNNAMNNGSMSSNNGSNGYNGTANTSGSTSSDMNGTNALPPRTDRN